MKPQSLARTLSIIAAAADKQESVADSILASVKASGVRDEKAWSAAVKDAYRANGWNVGRGRPAADYRGSNGRVPPTVRQYVSQVRAAFRAGIDVSRLKSFHALRKALKDRRATQRPQASTDPKMAGLRLVKGDALIGAPFHDLTVLYEKAAKAQQRQIVAEVQALVKRFSKDAGPQLTLKLAA